MKIRSNRRRGSVLPIFAVCLSTLVGMIALGVDLGVLAIANTQAQAAADIGALGGARMLNGLNANNNLTTAVSFASTATTNNSILGTPITASNPKQVTVQNGIYSYSTSAKAFAVDMSGNNPSGYPWTAMQISVSATQPTYFAQIFGLGPFNIGATAIAVHRPRDIALTLDFSTSMQYSSNTNVRGSPNSNSPTTGSMNGDTLYPQFGPWAIYPSSSGANPMMATSGYADRGGEAHATSNLTTSTSSGPPLVNDFLYDTSGSANGTGPFKNAFVGPNADSGAYNNSKGTYTTSPYPYIVTPAPDSWTNHPAPGLDGDLWPLDKGKSYVASPATQPISDFAATVQELLTGSNTAWSNSTKSTAGTPKTWDNDGYDLNPNTGGYQTGYVPGTPSTSTFKGYTMGPGYYGKTFYIWPPDPRTPVSSPGNASYLPGDWRQRYFGTSDNSVLWNSSGIWQSAGTVNYNAILAWINSGPQVLPPNLMAGKVIYYSSIPTSIPSSGLSLDQLFWKNYIDFVLGYNLYGPTTTLYGQASSNSSGGNTYAPAVGSAIKITAQSSLTGSPRPYMSYNDIPVHPRLAFWFGPLTMMAFLTGPPEYSQNWLPGTAHEAHAWHLKAGIQSAIQDIKNNHPNDYAALIYFSTLSQYNNARVPLGQNYTYMTNALFYPYSLINSTTGAVSGTMRPYDTNWNDLSQGVIPNSMGGTNPTGAFMTAYNEFQNNGRIGAAKLVIYETDGVTHDYYSVNSNYNSYTSNFTFGSNIDEPVSTTFTQSKTESIKMAGILCNPISGAVSRTISNPDFSVTVPAYNGFSTTRSPVSIHAIGFGELFEPYLTTMETQTGQPANAMQQTALKCMLYVQQASGTSAQTDTIGSCWGYPGTPTVPGSPGPPIVLGTGGYTTGSQSFKIIVGDYNTRVSLIQQALQRIMQSGVQVGLIQ